MPISISVVVISLVPKGIKLITTTEYHPQCNGQVERYNHGLVARLCRYLGEHQQDRDVFVQPFTNSYTTQVHWTTELLPFSLTLSWEPPRSLTFIGPRRTPEKYDRLAPRQTKIKVFDRLFAFFRRARDKSSQARRTYKKHLNKKVKHLQRFGSHDWVYAYKPPVAARRQTERKFMDDLSVKLRPKRMGPYRVIRTMEHTVVVDVDGLHNVTLFNCVSLTCTTNKDELWCGIVEDATEGANQQETTPDVGRECGCIQHSCNSETGTKK